MIWKGSEPDRVMVQAYMPALVNVSATAMPVRPDAPNMHIGASGDVPGILLLLILLVVVSASAAMAGNCWCCVRM